MGRSRTSRLCLLDELRGLLMALVVLYHLGYDLAVVFGWNMPWFWGWQMQSVRDVIAGLLMVLSGISSSLSHSNVRRGIRILLVAAGLTLGTALVMPSETIMFGILHFFGCCILLWALTEKYLQKVPVILGVALCAVLFAALRFLPSGGLLLPFSGWVALPSWLYESRFLFWLGLPASNFQSADYYPLIPWIFLFFAGGILGSTWKRQGFPPQFSPIRVPTLGLIGRHTMAVYLLHQLILLGILWLTFRLLAA